MAQVVETPEIASVADGVVASFAIPFTFTDAAEVQVWVVAADGSRSAQQADVDYVVSGANVVFLAGHIPAADSRVERLRRTPAAQPEAFGDDAAFRPQANEQTFDKAVRLIQEERARGDRAIRMPIGETGVILPPDALRDGKLPVFEDGGVGFLDTPERLVAIDADGKAYALPLVTALNEIGQTFFDDGLWSANGGVLTHDDGVFG